MNGIKINQCTVTLTRECNLRCYFCYAKKTHYLRKDVISYYNLKKIVDFCDSLNLKYIVFTGGEPTLHPQLIDILKYIKTKNNIMIPTIATNGIQLYDPEYCKLLINNGIKYIDVSLKGKDSSEFVKIVGKDYFMQQMRAIYNLSRLNIEFTCSMVLTLENINSLYETVKNAYENGAKQFSFTFVIDNIKSKENYMNYFNKNNPFVLIEAFISQIDKLNSITKNWWIEYSFPLCVYTEEQLNLLKDKLAYPCQVHYDNGITFDTDMNLIPCNMYFENKLGKLGKDFHLYKEFIELYHNSIYRTTINQLKQFPSAQCNTCMHLSYCYGGCPVIWKNFPFEFLVNMKNEYYSSH